ncbi:MAG TPA: FliG C-terminal domain-containing protein [Phycisphaerae bacterium]|nr:FliG C-terminal domain-containing protein [Phycisphaerae bacterium]
MKFATYWLGHLKARVGRLSVRTLAAVSIATLAVVGGAAWLIVDASAPEPLAAVSTGLSDEQLDEARDALTGRGIHAETRSGRLLVPEPRLQESRQVLDELGLAAGDAEPAFERLSDSDSIWSTQSQLAKRWQAAKMASLGRLIRRFPAVRSATVILAEGTHQRLIGQGRAPTASVAVELSPGQRMTDELAAAIADLVAGSVAGMRRHDVRIVDSTGRSHRLPEDDFAGNRALREISAAETYLRSKIRRGIRHVAEPIIEVEVNAQTVPPSCRRAWVSVPLSYLRAAARAEASNRGGSRLEPPSAGGAEPTAAELESAAARCQERIRAMVVLALGGDGAPDVRVNWHQDVALGGTEAARTGAPAQAAGSFGLIATACAAGCAALACGALLVSHWRRRRLARAAREGAEPGEAAPAGGALGMLQYAASQDILEFVKDEHPQTIAVVLSSLDCDRAAAVLAGLPQDVQLEVSRRIAGMDRLDPQMLREVNHTLAGRLAGLNLRSQPRIGGVRKLAELLHRAGPPTEDRVMQSLNEAAPDAASPAAHETFAFEDIELLDSRRLGAALESMDTRRLAVALRTASKPLSDKVLSCLSRRAAGRLRRQMERIGPVRLSEVEAAQQHVVDELMQAEAGSYVRSAGSEVMA